MSLQLYNPTTKSGIIDIIYRNTGADAVKYPLEDIVSDINLAKDKFMSLVLLSSGKWQIDDSNHTDYPIITTNLVSGQRDYSFTTDEHGNLILDIYRVMVADENDIFYDLEPVDQQNKDEDTLSMVNGQNLTGKPTKYDKTANGIFLDAIPDYSATGGLKIFINREATNFSVPTLGVADTTKPGFVGLFHEYLATRPTAYYAQRKGLKNANFWVNELIKYEGSEALRLNGSIKNYYANRSKDERIILKPESITDYI